MSYLIGFLLGAAFTEWLDGSVSHTVDNAQKAREEVQMLLNDEEKLHQYVMAYLAKMQQEGTLIIPASMQQLPQYKQVAAYQNPFQVQVPVAPQASPVGATILQK